MKHDPGRIFMTAGYLGGLAHRIRGLKVNDTDIGMLKDAGGYLIDFGLMLRKQQKQLKRKKKK